MKLNIEQAGLDGDAMDVVVDGKMCIHIKRNDCGYSVDFLNIAGHLLDDDGMTFLDEDLETEAENDYEFPF